MKNKNFKARELTKIIHYITAATLIGGAGFVSQVIAQENSVDETEEVIVTGNRAGKFCG